MKKKQLTREIIKLKGRVAELEAEILYLKMGITKPVAPFQPRPAIGYYPWYDQGYTWG